MHDNAKVRGFGGFFFRADDPNRLAESYEAALGIKRMPADYSGEPWFAESVSLDPAD